MSGEADYYAILGVSPDSEDVVIQAAYRALMRRYHPDTNSSAEAARKAVQINAAYAVLSDSAARAAYDLRRKAKVNQTGNTSKQRPPPPPPPPPGQNPYSAKSSKELPSAGGGGGLVFAAILTLVIIVGAIASRTSTSNANNTMEVDENLTTDMAVTDMNATDMSGMPDTNATEAMVNGVDLTPVDLSKQPQVAVSYDTIENAAKRVAKLIMTKGIDGARAYSEKCHKAVQNAPSWDSADDCAAFDYAAAYLDEIITRQGGWPKNGYFEFQSGNASDAYAAVGAPTYATSDRLSKLRDAAQTAAAEALRAELARRSATEQASNRQITSPQASMAPAPNVDANAM